MNSYILNLWRVWDFFYYFASRLQYVEPDKNLFRVLFVPYWGPDLETKNGGVIRKGDLIVKLHIHNFRLAEIMHERKKVNAYGILVLREIRESLPGLTRFIANHPRVDEIRGIVGTSFLHRGAEPLGFSIYTPPRTLLFKYKNWYLKWMLRLMHPDGKKRLNNRVNQLNIKRLYMTKDELFAKYL